MTRKKFRISQQSEVTFLSRPPRNLYRVFTSVCWAARAHIVHNLPMMYLIGRKGFVVKRVFSNRYWISPDVCVRVKRLLLRRDVSAP